MRCGVKNRCTKLLLKTRLANHPGFRQRGFWKMLAGWNCVERFIVLHHFDHEHVYIMQICHGLVLYAEMFLVVWRDGNEFIPPAIFSNEPSMNCQVHLIQNLCPTSTQFSACCPAFVDPQSRNNFLNFKDNWLFEGMKSYTHWYEVLIA